MLRSYLRIAVRSFASSPMYSLINVAGLAVAMAACILIYVFISYERSYDRWIPGAEDTYQFQAWYAPDQDAAALMQMTAYGSKTAALKDFPEITSAVYALSSNPVLLEGGEALPVEHYLVVDDDFLDTVRLPLLRGTTLGSAQTAVVTQDEALRRFGTDRVIGRVLTISSQGVARDFKIVGVLASLPKNTHLRLNAVLRVDFNGLFADDPRELTCWACQSGWVYLRLRPGTDVRRLVARLPAWEKRNIPDEVDGNLRSNAGDDQDWHFVRLREIHLGPAQLGAMTPGSDRRSIATIAIIAFLILSVAVVNFANLATARSSLRAREIALRKVLGAARSQLIAQFIGESILISLVAMVLALTLAELMVRPLGELLDAQLTLRYFGVGGVALPAVAIVLAVGVLGGIYPALFLSRLAPAQVLRANKSAADSPHAGRLRTSLVILQFAVSIGLGICTLVIVEQARYARTADPGYRRDHLLQIDNLGNVELRQGGEAMTERMLRVPGVLAVGRSDLAVATGNSSNSGILVPGASENVTIGRYRVDDGFFAAMGLTLRAGRWFDRARPGDDATVPYPSDPATELQVSRRGINVVVNELAVRKLGFKDPTEAIGKTVTGQLFSPAAGQVPATIIGVVADSRFRSVRTPIDPLMFLNVREGPSFMVVRYEGNPQAVRSAAEQIWRESTTEVPFEAKFSDDILDEQYQAEDARALVFAAFAALAVMIGCLGLFGLAAFSAERRTKEIGVRKVLGATTPDIAHLLLWQFTKPVIAANLIAWPIAWWAMRDWLNGFDAAVSLSPVPFVLAGITALAIAVATVTTHAVRIAGANPVQALRYE